MSLDVTIRHSSPTDLQDMVILMDQLGYPTTFAEMEVRYTHIAADANFTTLVAEVRGRVVGLIGLQTSYLYEKNGRHCRIVALVVHDKFRGSGIGRQLILEAEQWAATHNVDSLSLNSANRRNVTLHINSIVRWASQPEAPVLAKSRRFYSTLNLRIRHPDDMKRTPYSAHWPIKGVLPYSYGESLYFNVSLKDGQCKSSLFLVPYLQ